MDKSVFKTGHNDEEKVVKQSPVRLSGLSEVQLVNMGKGLYRNRKPVGGRDRRKGRR